jgi:hypothetical protein
MTTIIDGSAGITFPSGTNAQAAPSKVLQVVNATYSTQVGVATSTFTDTGLTASITPLFSNSKILVIASVAGCYVDGNTNQNSGMKLQLVRNSTSLIQNEGSLLLHDPSGVSFNLVGSATTNYLDSPATTSATTYKMQFCKASSNAGSVYVQIFGNSTSTITLMEIAA